MSAARALATWFGCGLFPWGPGTCGSAAALLIAFLLHEYAAVTALAFAALGGVAAVTGVWASDRVSRESGEKDPQFVVIDEVAGQWIALAGAMPLNWKSWLAAFALFRLFDIWKPWPVARLESLPGGYGVVADDVMAGIYAALVMYAAGWLDLY